MSGLKPRTGRKNSLRVRDHTSVPDCARAGSVADSMKASCFDGSAFVHNLNRLIARTEHRGLKDVGCVGRMTAVRVIRPLSILHVAITVAGSQHEVGMTAVRVCADHAFQNLDSM